MSVERTDVHRKWKTNVRFNYLTKSTLNCLGWQYTVNLRLQWFRSTWSLIETSLCESVVGADSECCSVRCDDSNVVALRIYTFLPDHFSDKIADTASRNPPSSSCRAATSLSKHVSSHHGHPNTSAFILLIYEFVKPSMVKYLLIHNYLLQRTVSECMLS